MMFHTTRVVGPNCQQLLGASRSYKKHRVHEWRIFGGCKDTAHWRSAGHSTCTAGAVDKTHDEVQHPTQQQGCLHPTGSVAKPSNSNSIGMSKMLGGYSFSRSLSASTHPALRQLHTELQVLLAPQHIHHHLIAYTLGI